jgi:uncharacterized coiled-coil DUF342 family protein
VAAANFAERKRQRENNQEAFEAREKRTVAAIARLAEELQEIQKQRTKSSSMRDWDAECRQLHQHNDELAKKLGGLHEQIAALTKEKQELMRQSRTTKDPGDKTQMHAQLELAVRDISCTGIPSSIVMNCQLRPHGCLSLP